MSYRNSEIKIQLNDRGLVQELSLQHDNQELARARIHLDPSPDLIPAGLRDKRVGLVDEIKLSDQQELNHSLISEIYKVARTEGLEYLLSVNHENNDSDFRQAGFKKIDERLYFPRNGWNGIFLLQLADEKALLSQNSFLADICRFYNGMERLGRFFQPMPAAFDAFDFTGAAV